MKFGIKILKPIVTCGYCRWTVHRVCASRFRSYAPILMRSMEFSPDVHWIAYVSNDSGRLEIYVRLLAAQGGGGRWMVTHGGGIQPRRRQCRCPRDGRPLRPAYPRSCSKPHPMRDGMCRADGKRFLFPIPTGDTAQAPFTVVQTYPLLDGG